MRGKRLTAEDAIDIFFEKDRNIMQKVTARRFGISQSHVCKIQCGLVFREVTALYCDPKVISATLITLACTGEA